MNIVKKLTNSNFVLVYKGFWKAWGSRIVGVGFCGEGVEIVGFIMGFGRLGLILVVFGDVWKIGLIVKIYIK